jgi:hypothetical protein
MANAIVPIVAAVSASDADLARSLTAALQQTGLSILEWLTSGGTSSNWEYVGNDLSAAKSMLATLVGDAHIPETYLAWMLALQNHNAPGYVNSPSQTYVRLITVACPVDVYVYDGDEELAGSVVGGTAQAIDDSVRLYAFDDKKLIYLPMDADYTIKLIGSDDGTMEYAVEKLEALSGETSEIIAFTNVGLFSGKQMTSQVGGDIETPDIQLFVLDESDTPVKEVQTDGKETTAGDSSGNTPGNNNSAGIGGGGGGGGGGSGGDESDTSAAPADEEKIDAAPETAEWVNPFTDVKESDWFYGDVRYVHENGLFAGTSATTFSPGTPMTRGMIVTVLGRLYGTDTEAYASSGFDDVTPGKYYTPYVEWAKQNGIVSGVGGNRFSPDAEITRQDLAVIITRYADFAEKQFPVTLQYAVFTDEADIAEYAKSAVQTLYCGSIVSGKPNNLFDPKGNATRAEVAAILHRFTDRTGE